MSATGERKTCEQLLEALLDILDDLHDLRDEVEETRCQYRMSHMLGQEWAAAASISEEPLTRNAARLYLAKRPA